MKMTSMKMAKKEMEAKSEPAKMDQPQYPWGLKINLDNEALQKLGMKEMPKVGQKLMLHAKVEVTDAHASDVKGGKKNVSCGIQITDMALEGEGEEYEMKERMYGEGVKGKAKE